MNRTLSSLLRHAVGHFALFALVALAALVPACQRDLGVVTLRLVTAPGSDVLSADRVVRARLTLSDPPTVVESDRDPSGQIALDVDIPAAGALGTITFEGLDRQGAVVAFGRSGPVPFVGITADVAIYVAAPFSIDRAPVALEPARTDVGVAALASGVLFVGGRAGDGEVLDIVDHYSVYDHALRAAGSADEHRVAALPATRAGAAVVTGDAGDVYIFGGEDEAGASPEGWRLVTGIGARGSYFALASDPSFARVGARGALHGVNQVVVTGSPLLFLAAQGQRASAVSGQAVPLTSTATTAIHEARFFTLLAGLGAGEGGVLLVDGELAEVTGSSALARLGHATVTLPDGSFLTVAGELDGALVTSAVHLDPVTGALDVMDGFLATARRDAAVAVTAEHLIVAGGVDSAGAVLGDAEIFDAGTLAPVKTLQLLVPRQGAAASALPSGQVLIAGGADSAGQPIAAIELFTPGP